MATSAVSLVDTLCEKAQVLLNNNDVDCVESLASEAIVRDPVCNRAHQLLMRVALLRGEADRARTLLNRWRDLPVDDAFLTWGVLAEEVGDVDTAVEIYKAHLAQHPQEPVALLGLAMLYVDRNEQGQAQALLQRLIQQHPDHVEGLFELAQLYEEDGMMGLAQELYGRVLALEPEHEGARSGQDMVEAQLDASQALPQVDVKAIPNGAGLMLDLFVGRKDVYARQWIDEEGKTGYVPVREVLTEDALQAHLRGDATLGVYSVFDGDKAQFLAFDIDIEKASLEKVQGNEVLMEALKEQVYKDVRRICAGFSMLHLPVSVESSGYKGAHVWLFFDQPVRAEHIRKFGQAFIKRFGPPSEGLQWELFPKQDALGEGELGNLIKLPLGVHRKTGQRALFVDLDGQVLADQGAVLKSIKQVDGQGFKEAISRLMARNHQAKLPLEKVDLDAQFPEFKSVMAGCAVVRSLSEKAFATHHLTHSERHVLKCVFGHTGEKGREFLHAVIGACADYNVEVTNYQIGRLRLHPIGCPKIRRHLPDLVETVPCACEFELPEGGYPSPVLHIDPAFTENMGRVDRPADREVVDRYVTLRQKMAQLRFELTRAEDDVRNVLRERGGKLSAGAWVVDVDEQGRLQVGIGEV